MPAEYRKTETGIAFQYPENWQLDEEQPDGGRTSVTVYSPGGAFWTLSVDLETPEPAALASAAVEAMRAEYSQVEVEEAEDIVDGRRMIGFDLNFYYLDLTNTAAVRCLQTEEATYTFFYQAEDREYDQIHPVFLAMTTSVLRNLPDRE